MSDTAPSQVLRLLRQGVHMSNPDSVTVDHSVNIGQIAPGVVIHPGCRVTGSKTSIGPGCVLGQEAPVTLDNCQLGAQVRLAGGYFTGSTFLARSWMGSGAHIRPGTLVEEQAGGAHTVGLKQTILFPYAVMGSLINFCDALIAGGTSHQHHSEIGSAYIHFNFTPHNDKATASLIGDVPRGVMLDQLPVFLGGQGGMAGPAKVEFGAVVPAGTIVRGDIPNSGLFLPEIRARKPPTQYQAGAYQSINRIVINNLNYIGNIHALRAWYRQVRSRFLNNNAFLAACLAGAEERFTTILDERIHRLQQLAENMPRSLALAKSASNTLDLNAQPYMQQATLIERWPHMRERLINLEAEEGDREKRDRLMEGLARIPAHTDYLDAVKSLSPEAKADGTAWLNSIVATAVRLWPHVK